MDQPVRFEPAALLDIDEVNALLDEIEGAVATAGGASGSKITPVGTLGLPVPVPNRPLVGGVGGWSVEDTLAEVLGAPASTPLPVAQGGTGGSDQPGIASNLGLGTVAFLDTGTEVPVLQAGGLLPASTLRTPTSGSRGVPGPHPGDGVSLLVAAGGQAPSWASLGVRRPLLVVDATSGTVVSARASGAAWAEYTQFAIEGFAYGTSASADFRLRIDVGGTVETGLASVASTWYTTAEGGLTSGGAGNQDGMLLARGSGVAPNTAFGTTFFTGRVYQNGGRVTIFVSGSTGERTNSAAGWRASYRSAGAGDFRGLTLTTSAGTFTRARLRVWGMR